MKNPAHIDSRCSILDLTNSTSCGSFNYIFESLERLFCDSFMVLFVDARQAGEENDLSGVVAKITKPSKRAERCEQNKDFRDNFRADTENNLSPLLAVLSIRKMTKKDQDYSSRSSDAPKNCAFVEKLIAVTTKTCLLVKFSFSITGGT